MTIGHWLVAFKRSGPFLKMPLFMIGTERHSTFGVRWLGFVVAVWCSPSWAVVNCPRCKAAFIANESDAAWERVVARYASRATR